VTVYQLLGTSRRQAICGAVLALVATGHIGQAQQLPGPGARMGPPAAGTAIIVGQVTEAGTMRPVAGATVAISASPAASSNPDMGEAMPMERLMSLDLTGALSGMRQTLTDAQGRFAFTGLPRGAYGFQATKPGWTSAGYGQLRPDSQSMPLILNEGEALENVSLRLWKYSVVSGTVLDEAGEPIVGLGVRALGRTWLAGKPKLVTAGSGQTDDRGMYRISSLVPGEYVMTIPQTMATSPAGSAGPPVDLAAIQAMIASRGTSADPSALMSMLSAMTPGSGGGIRVGDWVIQTSAMGSRTVPPISLGNGRLLGYQTMFFPASSSASQATTVTLGSGDERGGLDFQLRPVAVMSVSGTVTGPEGPVAGVGVRLLANGADDFSTDAVFDTATTTSNGTGAFTFLAVPPGQYTLRVLKIPMPAAPAAGPRPDVSAIQNASGGMTTSISSMTMDMLLPAAPAIPSAPTLWATMPVSVGDGDVTGFAVPLRTGFRVSGRLAFDGTGTPPALTQFRRIPVMLDRVGGGNIGPAAMLGGARGDGGQFDDNGQFSTYGVVPGKYFVRVPFSISGWALKSATLGGRDLADVPLTIDSGDVSGVVLTFTDRTSDLSGAVQNDQGRPDGEASVVVFPSDPAMRIDFGSSPRRLRASRTSRDGRYRFSGLPPGDYLVAALRGDIGSDWQSPAFLETVSRTATKVTVSDGDRKTQDLRTAR